MSGKVYRTAIYARLSKDDGDGEVSNSIVSQREICEEYIRDHEDLRLADVFVDDGYSGVDFERPAFKEMEQAIRDKKIDAIICKDLSRFSRNYIGGGRYLERIFPALGIRFIAISDNYDTLKSDPSSDSIIIPFKNLINDSYCRDISIKIRSSLDVKRRKGEYVGPFTPYGYKKAEGDKNSLVVDEEAGEIVRQIFSYYKEGISIGRIADRLNDMGVPSPMEYKLASGVKLGSAFRRRKEAKWCYSAVRRILTNEVYIGVLVQGKHGTPNYKVHAIREKDESEWIRVEGTHEALVSYEDFMAVKELLGRDMRSASFDNEDNAFSGFLFCGDCKQTMVRNVIKSKGKKYFYYVCSTNRRHEGCSGHCISMKKLSEAVLGAIQTQISDVLDLSETLDYIDRLPSADRKVFNYDTQIEKLSGEIDRCRRMRLRTYEDFSAGVISKSEYMDFRKQYKDMIDEKSEALERVRKERDEASVSGDSERAWVALFREYDGIEEVSRRVLMALVDRIYVYEGHSVEVVFKYGDEYERALKYIGMHADVVSAGKAL